MFKSPAVCAPGKVTETVDVGACGVAAATCAYPIETGDVYVNPFARLPLCPFKLTVTVTAPAAFAGVVAVIVVLFVTTTLVADAVPNVTVAPDVKFIPLIVTLVPPEVGPLFGDMEVTVGGFTFGVVVVAMADQPLRFPA